MKKRFFLLMLILLVIPAALFAQRSTGRGSRVSNYNLKITSNATGASVTIEPQDVKEVVGNFRLPHEITLEEGNYVLTVEAAGYISQTRIITLDGNKTENFNLQPATGRVEIIISGDFLNMKVNNPRARIRIYDNGEQLPGDGLVFELRPGQHTIQLVSGGLMVQKTIRVEAGQVYRLEPVFELQLR